MEEKNEFNQLSFLTSQDFTFGNAPLYFENIPDELKKSEDIKKNLVINDGDWSGKVSRELQELGVVDSASSFDRYLMDNGYSNRINSGTYEVSPDDTFEEIAKKINISDAFLGDEFADYALNLLPIPKY